MDTAVNIIRATNINQIHMKIINTITRGLVEFRIQVPDILGHLIIATFLVSSPEQIKDNGR